MKPCFLEISEDADGWVSAALLVTDANTRPLEFRITERLHVDEVQQALYGTAFEEHLYGSCLAAPLLEAVRGDPDVVLVRDRRLLALHGVCPVPVLWIDRDEDDPSGYAIMARDGGDDMTAIRGWLAEAVRGRDLLEPFARITTALERLPADAVGARG